MNTPRAHNDHNILQIIMGPMFSGKSTELRRRISRYASYKENITVINSVLDTRTDRDTLSTHDKTVDIKLSAIKLKSLMDIDRAVYSNSHVIGIDEAQFFDDLCEFVEQAINDGKICIVAGLDSDFNCRPFGHILKIIPFATDVQKLQACCMVCKDGTPASFTIKTQGIRESNTTDVVDVGGSDKYISVCWKHRKN